MEWFFKFPHMGDDALRNPKKMIDLEKHREVVHG